MARVAVEASRSQRGWTPSRTLFSSVRPTTQPRCVPRSTPCGNTRSPYANLLHRGEVVRGCRRALTARPFTCSATIRSRADFVVFALDRLSVPRKYLPTAPPWQGPPRAAACELGRVTPS